ncbi:MAG: serine hydrolase [Saprospiraceae bacterium]
MRFFTTLLFIILSLSGRAQVAALPAEVTSSIQKRIDSGTNTSIVVGIINADGPRYYSFGKTTEGGSPVNEHSIYEIGSISKTFTATLLADMVRKGEMSLDDPIEKYLPTSVHVPMYGGKHITLGNLSDHTSSLPRMPNNFAPADPMNPYADYTVDQLYAFLSSYELQRPIGSEYEYSNLAVGLLGHILSLKAGKSYEDLMVSMIAGPLQMNETRITFTDEMKKNLAIGHAMGVEVPNWDLPTLAGAGAIRSSVSDMLKYLSAQMGSHPGALYEDMELTHQARHDKANGNSVGLGWHMTQGVHELIWHNGATGGYMTFVGFDNATKTGVAVFTNSSESVDDIGFHLLDPARELKTIKPKITTRLKEIIETKGPSKLDKEFKALKAKNTGQYAIDENDINTLGYYYMNGNALDAAMALFKINMMEFPASFNVYDSYGEVLMKKGKTKEAIKNYQKSMELNPGNENGIEMLAKMGVTYKKVEFKVAENILQTYVGTYQLAPNFNIVITRDGTQLFGQATGQSQFELFPKSETEYFLKVAVASVIFTKDKDGKMGLTLYQNGAVLPGKRI